MCVCVCVCVLHQSEAGDVCYCCSLSPSTQCPEEKMLELHPAHSCGTMRILLKVHLYTRMHAHNTAGYLHWAVGRNLHIVTYKNAVYCSTTDVSDVCRGVCAELVAGQCPLQLIESRWTQWIAMCDHTVLWHSTFQIRGGRFVSCCLQGAAGVAFYTLWGSFKIL